MNKSKLRKIERLAIDRINEYYNLKESTEVVGCRMCYIIGDGKNYDESICKKCPFNSGNLTCADHYTNGDYLGVASRLGKRKSNKAEHQRILKNRYNRWARQHGLTPLVWVK